MKIAIRLDDITPDLDWDRFNRFRELMDRYGVKPLLGVVPECRDPKLHINEPRADFYALLQELVSSGYVLAMHGVHHVYSTARGGIFPLNRQSEFAGLPFEEQDRMIAEGVCLLREHGIETDIFMAPAHSYDGNTLKALKKNGFTKITDGFGTEPYRYRDITFYPISFLQKQSLKEKDGMTTFVVHVNTLNDSDFDRYERIFREQEMLPYRDYLSCAALPRSGAGQLKERLMALGKRTAGELRSGRKHRK